MASKSYLKIVKSLNKKKFRNKHSLFLVEGIRGCEELIRSSFQADHIFYTASGVLNTRIKKLLAAFEPQGISSEEISPDEINFISDAVKSQNIIAVARLPMDPPRVDLSKMNRVLCLESISDPGNLGTIIRTASWFGIDAIVLSTGSVDVYSPKVVRSSSGGIFKIPILSDVALIEFIQEARVAAFEIIATLPQGGKSLREFEFAEKNLLIFGSEADGISARIISAADTLLSIPAERAAESLNLAVSCGIFLSLMDYKSRR